ncbi:hypothetical protein TMatcc_001350 [Talaromyces marneffei ATCC 18224]
MNRATQTHLFKRLSDMYKDSQHPLTKSQARKNERRRNPSILPEIPSNPVSQGKCDEKKKKERKKEEKVNEQKAY